MARVKLTEYKAKKIILGDAYAGVAITTKEKTSLPKRGRFVVKVDQGVKKRFIQGLVTIDLPATAIEKKLAQWRKKGYTRFMVEPYFPHEEKEERYLSLERTRKGIRVLYAQEGGVDIESHPEKIKSHLIVTPAERQAVAEASNIPKAFFTKLCEEFDANHFAFLEINPLVVRGKDVWLLDAAALADDAALHLVRDAWGTSDIVQAGEKHPAEKAVDALASTTPASLSLSVVNPNGALFFLLSGGGGSIVVADAAQMHGAGNLIGNYGEYSGGPSREETYLYTKEIIALLLHARAKKKALVIAGGVANFTDVQQTFLGIIDALGEVAPRLRKAKVRVFVRRGGPNEAAGLSLMKEFLTKEKLLGAVHGSDTGITTAVDKALRYIRS